MEEVEPRLHGELFRGGEPADSGTVVLHRVNPEVAGPVDSIQTGPDGTFQLILPDMPIPGSGEIYFASVRYEGILYFGPAIAEPAQLDSIYRIRSYPTQEAPVGGMPFQVEVRNLFVDPGPMGWRVTDLFQIRNDSSVTWVGSGEDEIVWQYPLPAQARSFRLGQNGAAPDAIRFQEGGLQLLSPVAPGEELFMVQYELEDLEFTLPLPGRTRILEIMVSEDAPSLRMEGLSQAQPVEMEDGAIYRRWAGEDLSDRAIRVERGEEGENGLLPWIGIGLALILLGLGIWAIRRVPSGELRGGAGSDRRSTSQDPGGRPPESRAELLLAIAELDETFSAMEDPTPMDRRQYESERNRLLSRLSDLAPDSGSADPATPDRPELPTRSDPSRNDLQDGP